MVEENFDIFMSEMLQNRGVRLNFINLFTFRIQISDSIYLYHS